MSVGTFDAAAKRALIADFEERGPLRTLWLGAPTEDGVGTVVARTGLHPAFVALLPAVGGYEGGEEASRFYLDLLDAIAPGTNGLGLVQRWYLAVWDMPAVGPAEALRDTPAFDAAAAIVAMVRENMVRPVAPKAWRAARAALSRAEDAAGGDILFTEPVLAMAWDLDTTPAASADVFYGWDTSAMTKAQADLGWTAADSDRLLPLMEEFSKRAVDDVGPPSATDATWMTRYQERIERCWTERSDLGDLKARHDVRVARVGAVHAEVVAAARRSLLACAGSNVKG